MILGSDGPDELNVTRKIVEEVAEKAADVPSIAKTLEQEKRVFSPKSVEEMASDLRAKIGKNSVQFRTSNKTGHIDLEGDSHFDKLTKSDIATPHIQSKDIHVGQNGKISVSKKSEVIRPATKADIRVAQRLAEIQGLLNNFEKEIEDSFTNDKGGFVP